MAGYDTIEGKRTDLSFIKRFNELTNLRGPVQALTQTSPLSEEFNRNYYMYDYIHLKVYRATSRFLADVTH